MSTVNNEDNRTKSMTSFRYKLNSHQNSSCYNNRTKYDMDMTLAPETKHNKKNMTTSKYSNCNVVTIIYDAIIDFLILINDDPLVGKF